MSFAGLIKFLLGFLLALVILAGGSVAAALYFVTKLTALPPRPTFSNDKPAVTATTTSTDKSQKSAASGASQTSSQKPAQKQLEPGAYRARVSWPDGLILRDRPSYDAGSIGGIEFNGQVVVVEQTADKEWEKVRVETTGQEGWVKGGNTERTN